jgi:hypothetical protein
LFYYFSWLAFKQIESHFKIKGILYLLTHLVVVLVVVASKKKFNFFFENIIN